VAYQGKLVRVNGVIRLEHEGTALYFVKEHAERSLSESSIWLALSRAQLQELKSKKIRTGDYVQVEGVFEDKPGGHFGLYPASINEINLVMGIGRN